MSGWPSLLALAIGSGIVVSHGVLSRADYRLPWVMNVTRSLPKGIYETVPCDWDDPATLVQFLPPDDALALYRERGYLGERMTLIKPIGAFSGDEVCWDESVLTINERRVVDVPVDDAMGRPLPHPSGCEVIPNGSLLPLQTDHSRSLDGRYFGSIPRSKILACVRPLWVEQPE